MQKNVKISVLIHTYQREQKVIDLLTQLSLQSHIPDEVIVVENIKDGQYLNSKRLKKIFKNSLCKYFSVNASNVAVSRNISLKNATGKILISIDDDIVIYESLIKEIIDFLNKYKSIDVVFPKILPVKYNKYTYIASLFLNHQLLLRKKNQRVKTFSSSFFILRTNLVKDHNILFDETLDTGEDIDFFAKVNMSGGKLYYCPFIEVRHYYVDNFFCYLIKHLKYGKDLSKISFFTQENGYIYEYFPARKLHVFIFPYFVVTKMLIVTSRICKQHKLPLEYLFPIFLHELTYWLGIYSSKEGRKIFCKNLFKILNKGAI